MAASTVGPITIRILSVQMTDGKKNIWTQRNSEDIRNQNAEYGPSAANVAIINRCDSPDGFGDPRGGIRANT